MEIMVDKQVDKVNKTQKTHLPHTGYIHALVCSCIEVNDLEWGGLEKEVVKDTSIQVSCHHLSFQWPAPSLLFSQPFKHPKISLTLMSPNERKTTASRWWPQVPPP